MTTYTITKDQKPTKEQLDEIEQASKMPITFDEDSPEMTPAMYEKFHQAIIEGKRPIRA